MIISHKHKYLFVELPFTASTAISKELCKNYDGSPILHKHATYYDFLKVATAQEKTYFVFSGIRNPLDETVSRYFKFKSDHNAKFSNPEKWRKGSNFINYVVGMRSYNFIKNADADFSAFFRKFYKIPYNNWSNLSHKKFDFIIRFEHLQEDFADVLKLQGIEQIKPLPASNRTGGKKKDFSLYYTPEDIGRAKRVFGPFMKNWGYNFPQGWGDNTVPWLSQMEFHFFNIFRDFYWKYLRSRIP